MKLHDFGWRKSAESVRGAARVAPFPVGSVELYYKFNDKWSMLFYNYFQQVFLMNEGRGRSNKKYDKSDGGDYTMETNRYTLFGEVNVPDDKRDELNGYVFARSMVGKISIYMLQLL